MGSKAISTGTRQAPEVEVPASANCVWVFSSDGYLQELTRKGKNAGTQAGGNWHGNYPG
ncbi:hypothetical protein [Microcoleus sp. FACHB-68]|uniref:hypothetical protein n=1 Tax=Microcoleus sp. FACHB-68 TaxID=2692826 RepID=UPI001689CA3C|nr:hypothetical protein [Microcoleus sp. FACHB-68]MBD1937441.1 hypothetical protein [Microcoleus sp. FACHB-68]